jgi:transcriptional regulator with XRE-family HTH domain
MELGERIATVREDQALTQAELAEKSKISPSTLSQIESGKVPRPHVGTVRKIARALGMDPAELRRTEERPLPKARRRWSLEPSFNDVLGDQRREDIYRPWLEFVNRYAGRWEQRIEAGDFDLGSINEFIATNDALMPTLHELNAQELREFPVDVPYMFGGQAAMTGQAIWRLADLIDPMIEAGAAKFDNSELEQLRRKRAEQKTALGDHVQRGA